ncbi:MAG: S9 family peptidase [Acidobacteriota bacterium]|nr:S9 family peptidase [Acidobacteriota bacterium]
MNYSPARSTAITVAIVYLVLPSVSASQPRGLLPADFYSEVSVGEVAISPDGTLIAFTATTVNEERNLRHQEIWMQELRGGRPEGELFRFTDPTREASAPRWSPDSQILSFQSMRSERGDSDTWFARVTFPGGEAYQVAGVMGSPIWSPDGNWIAYTHRPDKDSPNNQPDHNAWIAPDAITNTLDVDRFDGRVITSSRYKNDGDLTLRPHPSTQVKHQLFIVPAGGGEPVQRTDMRFSVGSVVWSPDGERLYFTGDELEDDESSRVLTLDIYVIDRATGDPRKLSSNPGSESAPAVSPDGSRLAYLQRRGQGEPTDLRVVDLNTDGTFRGIPRNVTRDWDLRPGEPTWTADSEAVRFLASTGGSRHLFEVAEAGDLIRQVTTGDRQLNSISTSADSLIMAYTVTDSVSLAEAFVNRGDGSLQQRVSSFNDEWLSEITLQAAERLMWTADDGIDVEGWLIKPANYDPDQQYPMILKIHGGPHSAYGHAFDRSFQILSNAGFFVLYPNPRGSTGYSNSFTYATKGGWGEIDSEDYLGGLDAALAAYPSIDSTRIGISGGSYGGFMTNWLTATTSRFAAAVTSRSITNWESWYGSSDAQSLTDFEFGGPPWEQRELYRRLSPLSYVEHVTAPTLIIHSENDYRTPIGEAEQWFTALKSLDVPTEMIRYPRSSHGLSRNGEPWLLVDRLERIRSWFTHWLVE